MIILVFLEQIIIVMEEFNLFLSNYIQKYFLNFNLFLIEIFKKLAYE